jgi:predicted metal-binding protein
MADDDERRLHGKQANWQAAILVCRKCERRLGDRGFGPSGRLRLAKALRRRIRKSADRAGVKAKGRLAPAGVLEVGCQKLCPRGGVTVIVGAQPGRWLVADAGASTDEILTLAGVTLDAG